MSPIQRPTRDQVLVFPTVTKLRDWFEANHESTPEAFIGFYRKGVAKASVTYAEIVDEALCYGWIDGITFRVDDEVTTNRYTPRRRTSNWSAVNIAKVAELRAAARMRPAGIRAFEERDRSRDSSYFHERPALELPPDWLAHLETDADARRAWEGEAPGFRRQAADWVMSGKRPETRERRFAELVEAVSAGKRPGPFRAARVTHRPAT